MPGTEIQAVEVADVAVPLRRPTALANRVIHERHYVLVRVTTADGVRGIGFCYAGHRGGPVGALAVRELLAPVLLGQDATAVTALWDRMYQEVLLHGRTGVVMRALSACDIALWDRNARAAGLPLWRHLGGAEPAVPAYASGGYYGPGQGVAELADELRGYVNAGFDAVKLRVGGLDPEADAERVATARQAVGPGGRVMLDANNSFTDVPAAVAALRLWEQHDPYWIEEPFGPDDIAAHARLARRTNVFVATGEIEAGRWRFRELLEHEAAAILQTDAAVCGGITEFQRIAALASGYGVPICPHWFPDLHAHVVAAVPAATLVEYFPDVDVLNFPLLIDERLEVKDGRVLLTERPGLGFDYDEAAVAGYGHGWSARSAGSGSG